MKRLTTILIVAATVLLPCAAFSQQDDESTPAEPASQVDEAEEVEEPRVFGALDIDILVFGGFGAFLYPHVEPGVDIGVVPVGKDMAISVGAGVDFGWCALCGLITVASDVDISSSYWGPRGRANFHLGSLGGLIDTTTDSMTLDPYVGVWGGPTFYNFDFEGIVTAHQTTLILGPALGIRVGFADNTFLVTGEYRLGAEVGFTTVNVEGEDGTIYSATDAFSGRGSDFILGIGFRI